MGRSPYTASLTSAALFFLGVPIFFVGTVGGIQGIAYLGGFMMFAGIVLGVVAS